MPNLWLVLGQQRLLEIDQSMQPALSGLCRALGLRTHWDEASQTLYIASPLTGKRLVLGTLGTPPYNHLAESIAALLRSRVESSGGLVFPETASDLPPCDLHLRIAVGRMLAQDVSSTRRWFRPNIARTAQTLLSEAVAEETGLPCVGARLSLLGSRQKGAVAVEIEIGRPDDANEKQLESEALANQAAEGLYQGLNRLWAPPALTEAPASTEPAVAASPLKPVPEMSLPPEELGIEVEYVQPLAEPGEDAPRIVLFADYSFVQDATAETEEASEQPLEAVVEPGPEAASESAPPATLEPQPLPAAIPTLELEAAPKPEPVQEAEPMLIPESRVVLTKPAGTPIPFKFMPLSDPRIVPGATNVVVFQREAKGTGSAKAAQPSPPAPQPHPPASVAPELTAPSKAVTHAPPPAPEAAPPPLPQPPSDRLFTVQAGRPKRPSTPKEVRVIQGGATVIRKR